LFSDHPEAFVEFLGGRFRRKAGIKRLYIERLGARWVNNRNGPVHGFLSDHPQMQDIVDISQSGDRAYGRFRTLSSAGAHKSIADQHPRGLSQWWEGGVYENEFIKENGVWKIFKLRYFPFWHADFEDGWSNREPGLLKFLDKVYPEDPLGPEELLENPMLWPDTRVVPFHYTHPVTGEYTKDDDLRAPAYGKDVSNSKPPLSINT
jgi:SnoaL-like domain